MTMKFSPGDLVVDREADRGDRGTAVVVRVLPTVAANTHVDSLDATVAELNERYPRDDPVVEVMFNGHLDRRVPTWRSMLRDARMSEGVTFVDLLDDYSDEWDVPLREYAYPVSRLKARPYCEACYQRATYDDLDGVWRCLTAHEGSVRRNGATPMNADHEAPRRSDTWTRDEVREGSATHAFVPPGGPAADSSVADGGDESGDA